MSRPAAPRGAGEGRRNAGPGIRRRTLLAAASAGLAGPAGIAGCTASDPAPTVPEPLVTGNPVVVAPVRAAAVLTAYDVTADRPGMAAALREIWRRLAGTTATVAVGASLFDGRYGLPAPRLLTPMPAFRADVLDPRWCHGDLLVQLVGDAPEPLRRLAREPVPGLRPRWSIEGFHPTPPGQPVRNLFGFIEGTGNPDAADRELMSRLVWVQPGDDEPDWCVGGTYQVVRLIRMALPNWEADPVEVQERIIGRRRETGAPLGANRADAEPDYASDPEGRVIALDAHIRRANPRTPQSEAHRILRRSYSYRRPPEVPGVADVGQIFVCYQRDVERGFATIQRRLAGEALERYTLPFGGGYYFVLPPSGVEPLLDSTE